LGPVASSSGLAYWVWRRSARFGEVWVPDDRPPGWRPYTEGHWVYTDEWGWYWDSDGEEADWGWVTYHYGRWAHDRRLGWFWVPDDEWAPAWVDWRRGNDYVGWAPLPPEELIEEDEYRNDPEYWVFVQPRYLIAPRLRTYYLPRQRSVIVFRQTFVVNRTVRLERNRNRFAVNPGIQGRMRAARVTDASSPASAHACMPCPATNGTKRTASQTGRMRTRCATRNCCGRTWP